MNSKSLPWSRFKTDFCGGVYVWIKNKCWVYFPFLLGKKRGIMHQKEFIFKVQQRSSSLVYILLLLALQLLSNLNKSVYRHQSGGQGTTLNMLVLFRVQMSTLLNDWQIIDERLPIIIFKRIPSKKEKEKSQLAALIFCHLLYFCFSGLFFLPEESVLALWRKPWCNSCWLCDTVGKFPLLNGQIIAFGLLQEALQHDSELHSQLRVVITSVRPERKKKEDRIDQMKRWRNSVIAWRPITLTVPVVSRLINASNHQPSNCLIFQWLWW